ncbi:hypothetical protein CEXT_174481 [Caerostris extrusa]|uniref:RNase H type-1 domain-containing protein n=1 Tax=Caerostris extrusa TaxID=172846 RepID=A0AAV4RAT5_CAEEX|nr:hypothetical protein CEXT_174481 [Caerostris extrusa]
MATVDSRSGSTHAGHHMNAGPYFEMADMRDRQTVQIAQFVIGFWTVLHSFVCVLVATLLSIVNSEPWRRVEFFEGHLPLVSEDSKKYCLDSELKYTPLPTMHESFPYDSYLHIYTDGSFEGVIRNARAVIYSINFTLSYAIGRPFDNFDGETAAISLALVKIKKCEERKYLLFC